MSKVRIVTISILLVAYFLVSANEVDNSVFGQQGEMDIQYTTPISQNMTYSIERAPLISVNSHIVLNRSYVDPYGHFHYFQLPRFDYNRIVFNVSLEPRVATTAVTFSVYCDGRGVSVAENLSESRTLSIELNMTWIKELSARWLVDLSPSIRPIDDVIVHGLVVWVFSTVPLVPVAIDMQTTDGQSLFDSVLLGSISSYPPSLRLYKDNNTSSAADLYPRFVNHTLYLRPGNLTGSARWYPEHSSSIPVNITYFQNEEVAVDVRLLTIRIDLDIDTLYPITHIRLLRYYDIMYDLYVPPKLMPAYLYAPKEYSTHIEVSLSKIDFEHADRMDVASVHSSGNINLNGSYNLLVQVDFHNLTFGGFETTTHIISVLLTFMLFLLILLRVSLYLHISRRKIHRDFRLIPFLVFSILSVIPWFYNAHVFAPYHQDFAIPIHSLLMGPFPLVGYWVEGSSIVWTIPSEVVIWSIVSIILYWLPVLGSALHFGTPSNRRNDIGMGLLLFLPSLYIIDAQFATILTTGVPGSILLPIGLVVAIPTAWLFLVCVLSITGKYKVSDLYGLLARDSTPEPVTKEVIERKPDEFSLSMQFLDDFAIRRGWFVAFLFFLLLVLPCAITDESFLFLPLSGASGIGGGWDFPSFHLASLFIGVPYCLGGFFTIVALWRYIRREVSLVWVPIGSVLTYLSTLPGALLLGYTAFPTAAIAFVTLSFLVWLRQAYEDGDELEVSSMSADSDARRQQT